MGLSKRKISITVIVLVLFIGSAILFVVVPTPPLRLSFLYTTNDAQIGAVGVFQLENNLNEPVSSRGGFYQKTRAQGIEPEIGDYGAVIVGPYRFLPGANNIFRVWIPTNCEPYRLVLYCTPDSTVTVQYVSSYRMRLLGFASRHLPLSRRTIGRWAGTRFVFSQDFRAPPSNSEKGKATSPPQ